MIRTFNKNITDLPTDLDHRCAHALYVGSLASKKA